MTIADDEPNAQVQVQQPDQHPAWPRGTCRPVTVVGVGHRRWKSDLRDRRRQRNDAKRSGTLKSHRNPGSHDVLLYVSPPDAVGDLIDIN